MPIDPSKYRGATVEDLSPPPALSLSPSTPIHSALLTALSHDYTHLTVLHPQSRSLLGYLSIPHLQSLLSSNKVTDVDEVSRAMVRFDREKAKGRGYRVITMGTPLEELEAFFEGIEENAGDGVGKPAAKQDFAVVTDQERKFVLGVVTREDLDEFVRRRPR